MGKLILGNITIAESGGSGGVTKAYVDGEISRVEGEIPSLTGYATESWVTSQGYLTSHQSLAGYATQSWVNNQGFLTSHQSLKTINNQSIVGSGNITITGDVTKSYVDQEIARVESEIPSLTGYATESWVTSQGYLTSHQSLTGYATESWVNNQGFLTQHQDISGKQDTLVSGENIKTINNQSIVGTGNITISGGGVGQSEGTDMGEIFNVYSGANKNIATGRSSHSEGENCSSTGIRAHSEGLQCTATGNQSHAEGHGTIALGNIGNHAQGRYNVADANWIHMVGNGTSDTSRQNAHLIIRSGLHYIPGVGGYQGTETSLTGISDVATVINSKFDSSAVWTGTQAQWDALTSSQKASYTIALIR